MRGAGAAAIGHDAWASLTEAAARVAVPLAELMEDASLLIVDLTSMASRRKDDDSKVEDMAEDLAVDGGCGLALMGPGHGAAFLVFLPPLLSGPILKASSASFVVLAGIGGIALSTKLACAFAAASMAAGAQAMLQRHPEETRDRTLQRLCAVALGVSAAVYGGLAVFGGDARALPLLHRPELVARNFADAAAVPFFLCTLSAIAEQGPQRARIAGFWALLSTAAAATAAAVPQLTVPERLLALCVSYGCAEVAGYRTCQLATDATGTANRERSAMASELLCLGFRVYPVAQALALCFPSQTVLVPLAALDVVFKVGAAHVLLRSAEAVSRAVETGLGAQD